MQTAHEESGDSPSATPDQGRTASATALGVAALRAVHLLIDDPPPILADRLAIRLLGPHAEERLRANEARYRTRPSRALRSHVLLRSRHAEDLLEEAVTAGTRQFVVLGAGLDTFAYRQPEWAAALQILEIDHPASQRAKLERLDRAGIAVPPNVSLVPADLVIDPLQERLAGAGFDADQRAFVACLGVLPYLPPDTVERAFLFVAGLAPGSRIVATFAQPPIPGFDLLAERAAGAGEPWLTRSTVDEVDAMLAGLGFSHVSFLQPGDAQARYFAGRTDGLQAPRRVNTVIADT